MTRSCPKGSAPAAYASHATLPPPAQGSLPAGWLAFAGRGSNSPDRDERFQSALTSSSFPGLTLSQAGFTLSGTGCEHSADQGLTEAVRARLTMPATVFLLSPSSRRSAGSTSPHRRLPLGHRHQP